MTEHRPDRIVVLLEHARIGGGTLVAADLLAQWRSSGIEARTVVLGLADEGMRNTLDASGGVVVHELEGLLRRIRTVRRELRRATAHDAVVAVGDYCGLVAAAAGLGLPRWRRPAVVIAEHQPRPLASAVHDAHGALAAWATARIEALLRRRTAGSVFTSEGQAQTSSAWHRSARPGVVIPNPSRVPTADASTMAARRARLGRGEEVRLIAVGAINAQKDHATLIAAMRLLEPRFHLTIIGKGDLDDLRRRVDEAGLGDRIDLLGARDDVVQQLDQHDLHVLSSRWETAYPLVVIEALARGLPVVATACSPTMTGFADELPTVTVVPVGDPPALAEAIARASAHPPEVGTLMASAERLAARHDPAGAAARHLEFLAAAVRP